MPVNYPLLRRIRSSFARVFLVCAILTGQWVVVQPAEVIAQPMEPEPFLAAPATSVTVTAIEPQLGANFNLSVTFDNTGDETGYGPFVDLVIPHKGVDGVFPGVDAADLFDGISPQSPATVYTATYLGNNISAYTLNFPDDGSGTGCVNHPLAIDDQGMFRQVCGPAGDQLVVIRLPFGSFTPDQPRVAVTMPVTISPLADLDQALNIYARGGYQFGATPTVDWCCTVPKDTTILAGDDTTPSTWSVTTAVEPTLATLRKTTSPPDDEIATGPNSPQTFTITLDVATGQTLNNAQVVDTLPSTLAYLGDFAITPTGALSDTASPNLTEPEIGDPASRITNTLTAVLDPIIGVDGVDVTITFKYYIAAEDADSDPVIDPESGSATTTPNTASVSAEWTPLDDRDDIVTSVNVGPATATPTNKSLALQKDYSLVNPDGAAVPGDVVKYTLNFQVSDYFAFEDLTITDVLSDGQHFDPTHPVTFTVRRAGATTSYDMMAASTLGENVVVACDYLFSGGLPAECDADKTPAADGDGTTEIKFLLSEELVDRSESGQWLGDLANDLDQDGPTRGTLVYYAVIQDKFNNSTSGDPSINQGDVLDNHAKISGNLLACVAGTCSPLEPTAVYVTDTDQASVPIGSGGLEKTIYAVNDVVCSGADCVDVKIVPGDKVTYRFTYTLLSGDFEDLTFTDFLPLPVFKAYNPDATTSAEGNTSLTWQKDPAALPAVGKWGYGPTDTQQNQTSALEPSVTGYKADNKIIFDYGDFEDPTNTSRKVDVLFTVRTTREPFADGLYLTNQVRQQDKNTGQEAHVSDDYVRLQLTQPVLVSGKSAVSTDRAGVTPNPEIAAPIVFANPGISGSPWTGGAINSEYLQAHPINSAISGVDGGDQVKFAIVIENVGSSEDGAFDIVIQDVLKSGYIKPNFGAENVNLQIYRGDGTALGYTNLDADSLFGAGIEINDPGSGDAEYGKGACQGHDLASGKNVIIVTYDLKVDPNAKAGQIIENVGKLKNYSGSEGGPEYLPTPDEETAGAELASPSMTKTFVESQIIDGTVNTTAQVVIGEWVKYQLVITLPEAKLPNLRIVDTLDAGLTFDQQNSFVESVDANIAFTGSSTPTVSGNTITWNLGEVTNSANSNDTPETITIIYQVKTANVAGNQTDTKLNNSAQLLWDSLDEAGATVGKTTTAVSAEEVTVIEPAVTVTKTVETPGGGFDAGDTVTYTIVLKNSSSVPAYDVTLEDTFPASISSLVFAATDPVVDTAGVVTTGNFSVSSSALSTTTSFDMPADAGRTITLKFTGTLAYSITPGSAIQNTARARWTSMDGDVSGERTGTGTGVDDYTTTSQASFTVNAAKNDKYLNSTSEVFTGNVSGSEKVAIGEVVRYRLVTLLPEGTITNLQIKDVLPVGLTYLEDGQTKLAIVSDGTVTPGAIDAIPALDAGCMVSGTSADATTPASLPCTLPETQIGKNNNTTTDTNTFAAGDDVFFKLGNLVNNNNDADGEYIVLEFNVSVNNNTTNTNDAGDALANVFQVWHGTGADWKQSGTDSNSVTVMVAEPSITVTKAASITSGADASSEITYTITMTAASSGANRATAFDLATTDTLPSTVTIKPGITLNNNGNTTCTGNGAGATALTMGSSVSGQLVTITSTCLDPGKTISASFTVTINDTVPAGTAIKNDVELRYTSLPGVKSGERDGSGTPAVNDLRSTATVTTTVLAPQIVKQAPSASGYAIGNQVTYPILVTLPEGVTRALRVVDDAPAGMQFVSATVANVSSGITFTNPTPSQSPASPTEGQDVTLDFGDTTTPVDAGAANTFVVNVTLSVLDVPGNQIGGTLVNQAHLLYKAGVSSSDTTVAGGSQTITILEPRIVTTKSVTPATSVQSGTGLTYTVRFTNTGSSTAYDVTADDVLAQGVGTVTVTACKDNGGADVSASTSSAGGLLSFNGGWDILGSGWVECVYTTTAQSTLHLDGDHTNTIDADWYSGDGATGRHYDDSVARTVDGSQDQAQAVFSAEAATFSKAVDAASAPIGKVLTYTLTLSAPTGTLRNAKVVDTLPAGLVYVDNSQVVGAGISTASFTFDAPTGVLTWDFGADAAISVSPVTIQYQAVVANVSGNQAGGALANSAQLSYTDAQGSPQTLSDGETVTVTEPTLTIVKEIVNPPAVVDAGDNIDYRITITNATGANVSTAYDVHLTDTMNAGLDLIEGSVLKTVGSVSGAVTASQPLDLVLGDIAPGESVVLTYTAQVLSAVTPGSTIDNQANITWTSTSGTNPNERDGSGTTPNDYAATDSTSFGSGAYSISKSASVSTAVIGEEVSYALVITLPEGSSPDVTVVDELPSGLKYTGYEIATSGASLTAPYVGTVGAPTVSNTGGSGDDVTFTFASIQTTADNVADNNTFILWVKAQIVDEAANQDGVVLTNRATLRVSTGPNETTSDVSITVLEPSLTVAKTVDAPTPAPNQPITFTVSVENPSSISHAPAYDVAVTDALPAGLLYVANSATHPADWSVAFDEASRTLTFTGNLAVDQRVDLTYQATVDNTTTLGGTLTNTASLRWTSLTGTVSGERTGAGGVDDYVSTSQQTITFTGVDLSLSKSDGGATSTAGAEVTYTLSYQNHGNQTATNTMLTETLPANTTFVGPLGWVCGPATCVYSLGDVASGATGTVDFTVRVNDSIPSGVFEIQNKATIDADGDESITTNNEAVETTPVDAAPLLEVEKTDGLTVVSPGAPLTYQITVRNNGTQDAQGVELVDTLPEDVTFVSASDSPVISGADVTWPVFNLAAGNERVFSVTVKVNDAPQQSSLENVAKVQDDGSSGTVISDEVRDTDEVLAGTTKTVFSTNLTGTQGGQVAVGERVTYQLELNIPPGTLLSLQAIDVMDLGLAFVDCVAVEGVGLTTTLPGGFADACNDPTNPTVQSEPVSGGTAADQGRRVTFTLGDVTNANSTPATLRIRYDAAVLNIPENKSGRNDLGNTIQWKWSGGSLEGSSPALEILEPILVVEKKADRNVVPVNQVVQFELTIKHKPESQVAGYHVKITDQLPAGLTYVPGSLKITKDPGIGIVDDANAPLLVVNWDEFPLGAEATVTYMAKFVADGSTQNVATLTWSSTVDIPGTTIYNPFIDDRGYKPGTQTDDYYNDSSVKVSEPEELPHTGFAPGVVSVVPAQPSVLSYQKLGDVTLEIPALKLDLDVVGVPLNADGWDLTWLGNKAGYLDGTTYPGQVGTTAITGHVTLPNGKAGPFVNLSKLKWGDVITLHANGYRYAFEVRENQVILPGDFSVLGNDGYTWLTLLTCKEYDRLTGAYLRRVAVRAVLLSATPE